MTTGIIVGTRRGNGGAAHSPTRSREALSTLLKKRLLVSKGPHASVRLGIPLDVVER